MGGKPSKMPVPTIICPEGYDKDDFQKILTLYDRLDSNGNFGLENEELGEISALHVNNNIRELGNTIEDNDLKKELALKQVRETYRCNVQRLKNKYDSEVNDVIEKYKKKANDLRGEMERLDKMPEVDKVKCFREKIVNENGNVEFWKFFEYMKDRVHDIENIWFDKN